MTGSQTLRNGGNDDETSGLLGLWLAALVCADKRLLSATPMLLRARLVYGMKLPPSYTVQGRLNPIKERSLGVNTVLLDSWNDLPEFLTRIHPAEPLTALGGTAAN